MEHKVYKNKVITVVTEKIKKAGKDFEAYKVVEADCIVVLPIMGDKVIIERQYRYPVGRYIYELPAGHIDKGENPAKAAGRELEEETGYRARKITHMFDAYAEPGTSTVKYMFYLATDIIKSKTHRDPDEIIEVKLFSMKKILNMIKQNKIDDTKNVAAILHYEKFMKSKGK